MHAIESYTVQNIDKKQLRNAYYINYSWLIFWISVYNRQIYQIAESNRIESKLFCPNWNALLSRRVFQGERKRDRNGSTWSSVGNGVPANSHTYYY